MYLDTITGTNVVSGTPVVPVTHGELYPLREGLSTTVSDPSFRALNLGDTADDDAQVIKSLTATVDAPPTPVVEPISTPALTPVPVPTRLISVHQSIEPAWSEATQLLPVDMRRERCHVEVTSPAATATDGVVIMSEKRNGTGLGILSHGKRLDLDGHTGAVWALTSTGTVAAVNVDVWTVTK